MNLITTELLIPHRIRDMHREAERERMTPPGRRLSLARITAFAGRRLIRAGTWLECLNQPCPCPSPAAAPAHA